MRFLIAIFTNQASLTVIGSNTNASNAYSEILDVLTAPKTDAGGAATPPGEAAAYVIVLRNTGAATLVVTGTI